MRVTRPLEALVAWCDATLRTSEIPDYPGALNGLQLANDGAVSRIAAAVDGSQRAIDAAVAQGADLLLLHHGLFWGGAQRMTGAHGARLRTLVRHGVAVYASHLPLDLHPELGNNPRLAYALGLAPHGDFGRFQSIHVGVHGECDLDTTALASRLAAVVAPHGGRLHHTPIAPGRRTRRWGIVTGGGASSDTLREAAALGLDTLITGEGPHHTAVDAPELGVVILYGGHYATETLGVAALAERLGQEFGLPWSFVEAPTGT